MSNLRKLISRTHKAGHYVYATVESIVNGYASVLINNKGKRLTSLPIASKNVSVGDTVIVDYSGGTPPVVRPTGTAAEEQAADLAPEILIIEPATVPAYSSFAAYGISPTQFSSHVWTPLTWNNTEWDTHNYIQQGQIILPYDGYYVFVVHLALTGFPDRRGPWAYQNYRTQMRDAGVFDDRIFIDMAGSNFGFFAENMEYPIDTDPEIPVVVDCSGFILGVAGEIITIRIKQESPNEISSVDNGTLYPRVAAFRVSNGEFDTEQAIIGAINDPGDPSTGQPPGPGYTIDDSDIELQSNMGYLHVSRRDPAYVRAIANVAAVQNVYLTCRFQFTELTSEGVLRFFLRSSYDWADDKTPTKGYELAISNIGPVQLNRIENGVRTLIGNMMRPSSVLPYKLRFQTNGTTIQARFWLETESEPGTWDLSISDISGFETAGGFQLCFFREAGEDHMVYLDDIYLDNI